MKLRSRLASVKSARSDLSIYHENIAGDLHEEYSTLSYLFATKYTECGDSHVFYHQATRMGEIFCCKLATLEISKIAAIK